MDPFRAVCHSVDAACGQTAPSNQLLVAAPATPPSLDWELVFGKEVYDHIFNLNDRLTRWKQIPAPGEPGGFDLAWQAENFDEITEPRMAEGWEVTNGGRAYTFSLRRGWPSHAGNEFTAADVKWAFDRSFALHGITSFYNTLSTIERPEDVKVLDKYTVRIHLKTPNVMFPQNLAEVVTVIFPREVLEEDGDLKKRMIGTGPFTLKEHKRWLKNHDAGFGPFKLADLSPGRHVVWVAHKEHPFPPKLDKITFRQVPESSNRLAILMTGEAQAAEYLLPTDMQRVENSNDLRLWNFQGYVIASCPMNPKYPPLGDVRVRQALSYATPYPQILEKVYRGFAGPAHGPLSDHAAGFDPNLSPYTYDPRRARELLREGGHGNGFKTTLAYSTAEPLGEPIGTQLRSAFAGVGVTLELEALPPPTFIQALFTGTRPMFFQTFGADTPDPAYALGVFYQSKSSNNWGDTRARRPTPAWPRPGAPNSPGTSESRSTSAVPR